MSVRNNGDEPTFRVQRNDVLYTSIVDVTLVSDNLIDDTKNWRVTDSCPSSDHNTIEFDLDVQKDTTCHPRASTYLFNNKIADWVSFSDAVEKEIDSSGLLSLDMATIDAELLDDTVTQMTTVIRDACFASMKLRGFRKQYNPWWDTDLENQKREVIRLHHRISGRKKRHQDITEDARQLKEAKDTYAKSIRIASSKNFREFCNKQKKEDVYSLTNRLIKDAPVQRPPTTLRLGCNFTASSQQTADALINHFYPDDTLDTELRHRHLRSVSSSYPVTPNETEFTTDEILDALKTMNPNRAPGVDNLTSDICLRFTEKYPKFLESIFNRCLKLQHFPTPWKVACVKILPKPGKSDYSDLASFRPIGLLPIFGKVLEKLFVRRLSYEAKKRHLWNERQFGFREQTSTTDALMAAIRHIKENKQQKRQVIGVSLDIKAAFDNAWWPSIFEGLRRTECPANIFGLIQSYFEDRKVTLRHGDADTEKTMTKGCVQGSVCGPTFWNLVLDELLDVPLPKGCYIQAFADDVLLLVSGKDTIEVEAATNDALKSIFDWGASVKLSFSH